MIVLLVTARLRNFSIEALLTDTETMMCAYVGPTMGPSERRLIPCKADVYGHKVKIQILSDNDKEILSLCEVEVHGHYG